MVKDEDYIDLCREHDQNWSVSQDVWAVLGADLRFFALIHLQAFRFLWKCVKGVAFGWIVLLFSWIIYLLKPNEKKDEE